MPRELQHAYEDDLADMFTANGWSWKAVESDEFVDFSKKWVHPNIKVPSANHLSGPVLDRRVAQVEEDLKAQLAYKVGTGQCDGWKNITKTHLVGSLVTVDHEVRADIVS